MAVGRINSLGVGSGVLSYDVIDKLREADEKSMIRPIERKMEQNVEKQTALAEIKTLVSAIRTPTKILADYSSYLGRTTNVNSDAIKATVASGVPMQDIKVDVHQLAQGDINEVGGKFESRDSVFSENDVSLSFYTQGRTYKIDIKGGMSVGDVAQLVTDETNGEVTGIIMKTGGSKPYQLMLNSKGMGDQSRIYFGTVLSANIPSSAMDLGDDDLTLQLTDKNGNEQSLSIKLKTDGSGDSALALKEAIREAIESNSELKDLLDTEINVGLDKDGKGLVINDLRGYGISATGAQASSLGFGSGQAKQEPLIESGQMVKEGKLSGVVMIGSVPLDLAKMTKDKNTSEQNAQIIAQAIENIAGMHASTDGSGKLTLSSEVGEIKISAQDEAGKQAIGSIGLKSGTIQSYAKLQDSLFKIKNIQRGQDSLISYNGAQISRPTNEINDVVGGVSMSLQSTTEPGKPAIISIGRDDANIIEQVKEFVKAYNELVPKLNETTRYDEDTSIAGVFNGVSDIRTIRSSLNSLISYSELVDGKLASLVNYGITLNDKGVMFLDESMLTSAISADPKAAEEFFYGKDKQEVSGRETHIDGVFAKIDKFLATLADGSNSRLEAFGSSLERDAKALQKDKKSATELLDTRYETMASRFAAYDSQIAKTKNAFGSVQMMIDQSVAKK